MLFIGLFACNNSINIQKQASVFIDSLCYIGKLNKTDRLIIIRQIFQHHNTDLEGERNNHIYISLCNTSVPTVAIERRNKDATFCLFVCRSQMKVWNEHTSHAQNDVVIITNVAIFQPMYREGCGMWVISYDWSVNERALKWTLTMNRHTNKY